MNDYEEKAIEASAWFAAADSFQRACFAEWANWRFGKDVLDMSEAEFVEAYEGWMEPPFDI